MQEFRNELLEPPALHQKQSKCSQLVGLLLLAAPLIPALQLLFASRDFLIIFLVLVEKF